MRKWIKLFEAETKTKTKTAVDFDIGIAPGSAGDLSTQTGQSQPAVPGKTASARKTKAATIAPMPAEAGDHFANIHAAGLEDHMSDAEAAANAAHDGVTDMDGTPEPINPENLPQVISQELAQQGEGDFEPEWHQVKHLPGYMQSAIRSLGRMVFTPFTDTPIEDIQVLSTLSNPKDDVKRMMKWITRNGIRDDDAVLRFEQLMPGYNADVKIYNTEDCQFMLVKDFAGIYIYGWPGGRGVQLAAPEPMRRLEGLDAEVRANLSRLAELHSPLEVAYRAFMENEELFDRDGNPVDADGMPLDPAQTPAPQQGGSGQSNSTRKPIAPGSKPAGTATGVSTPVAKAKPAPVLNPVQQAAKDKADAARVQANTKPIN